MKTKTNKLDVLNKLIYSNLERILKKLNKRVHIKLYALVYDKKQTLIETVRVKKTVGNGLNTQISQDTLQTIADVYTELRINPGPLTNPYDDLKTYINLTWYNQYSNEELSNNLNSATLNSILGNGHIASIEGHNNDNRLLYVNQVPLQVGQFVYSVIYILELRNVEYENRKIFYLMPEISFLRMLLDYYFNDFFGLTNNKIKLNSDESITRKYNEDGIQFNRRVTRLFFGKIQKFIQEDICLDEFGTVFENDLNNEYYVNSLLEKIDDISCLTYESASPFGSILFINKEIILSQSIINFTITFTKEDRIRLEDSKRIRKLLELTNAEKDLYLIADENEIYGLGEVNWNLQKDTLAIRLDFTGLSKYSLVLVRTEAEPMNVGKLLIENEKKYYRSDISLIEKKLISVNFKNPRMGEEGYSSEKLINLLKNTFWEDNANYDQINEKIERLDSIVRKAREQKHGTMVVITEPLTAKQELISLSKQSTLIEPRVINYEYVKFLTAIDGAIYFDTDGNCHAIGVILDGRAKEDIGDASRGARYNSAHRYLHKLKDDEQKKCIIVIISEDGMVDLIPESEHEDMLLTIAEEIIDMIFEETSDIDKLKEKEDILLHSEIVDCDWLFNIAEVYFNYENYNRAVDFFEYGKERAEKSYIHPMYYNMLGNCYHEMENYEEAIKMYEISIKNEDNIGIKCTYINNISGSYRLKAKSTNQPEGEFEKAIEWLTQGLELTKNSSMELYNMRGICHYESSHEKKGQKKAVLLKRAIEDLSRAIEIQPKHSYYWNRFCTYDSLGQSKESVEDLINAEYLRHDDKCIENLSSIFKKKPELVAIAFKLYKDLCTQNEGPSQLAELLNTYLAKSEVSKVTEAAAGRESDED